MNRTSISRELLQATTHKGFSQWLINHLAPLCHAGIGLFYSFNDASQRLDLLGSYGLRLSNQSSGHYLPSEGMVGQCAAEHKAIFLNDVPDNCLRIDHATGDALLREIAEQLTAQLRANDTVARLGGDEFALVLEEMENAQMALGLCEKLGVALAKPYTLIVNDKQVDVRIGASIGIAPFVPNAHTDADERLMHAADEAMYEAKRSGKNRCVLASN